jgi:hypothetical protein
VNGGTFEVDPRAPLFFLSYARVRLAKNSPTAPQELNRNALQLFDDLSTHVSELIGRPAGADPGFIDRSLGGGERWTPELFRAAGTCQVFIPLISAPLLNSEWCAMEWDAFSRRTVVSRADQRSDHETAIIPVTWSPTEATDLPAAVRDIQRFSPEGLPDPNITAQYQREGVYGLLTMGLDPAYRAVVWRLAQRVVTILRTHWVAPLVPASTDGLRNIFQKEEG